MPLMMLLALCNTDASANGIKRPKSHVTPHFDHINLRNALGPLITNDIMPGLVQKRYHMTKNHAASCFDCPELRNALVPLMMLPHHRMLTVMLLA